MGLNSHINTNFHAPRSFLDRLNAIPRTDSVGSNCPSAHSPSGPHSARTKTFHALKVTCISPYPLLTFQGIPISRTIQGLQAVQNRGNDIPVRFCFKILCCNNFASTKNFKEVLAPTELYSNLKPLNLYFEIKMKCGMGNLTMQVHQ